MLNIIYFWTALRMWEIRFPSFQVAKSVMLPGSRCGGSSGGRLEVKRIQRLYLYWSENVFCRCGDACGGVVKSSRSGLGWLARARVRSYKEVLSFCDRIVLYFCDRIVFLGFYLGFAVNRLWNCRDDYLRFIYLVSVSFWDHRTNDWL